MRRICSGTRRTIVRREAPPGPERSPEILVGTEHRGCLGRHIRLRECKMAVELGRAADGLRRIVDEDVEPWKHTQKVGRKELDRRGMPKVEAIELKTVTPLVEVRLTRVTPGSVRGEACGADDSCACTQKLERHVVPDLDAGAGDEATRPLRSAVW